MAAQLNRGFAAIVANPQKSFTDYAVDTERRKRARKDTAIAEARGLLVSKQAFAPYAGAVNEFINNAVDEIAASDGLDPNAYTKAVEQYMEYYNYSKQVEGFLKEAASSYQKDKEVNEQVAAKAIMDRYVKDRSLDELATIAGQQMDAEDVLLKTPGALKTDVVIQERMKRFGDIILEYTEQAKKAKSVGGGNMVLEGENIAKKYKQYIKKDGDDVYVDAQALQDKGFLDVLLSDARVKAIAERELESEGITPPGSMAPVEEKKAYNQQVRDKLATIMTPFAEYQEVRKDADVRMTDWNARSRSSSSGGGKPKANNFNDWHRDLMASTQKAASYLKGVKVPVANLPITNPEDKKLFEDIDQVYVSSATISKSPDGGTMVDMTVRADDGYFEAKREEDRWSIFGTRKKVVSDNVKETTISIPIESLSDPEIASLLYQNSFSQRKAHYESSPGVGAGSTSQPTAKPKNLADILGKK